MQFPVAFAERVDFFIRRRAAVDVPQKIVEAKAITAVPEEEM
jgi:hypothetical protein